MKTIVISQKIVSRWQLCFEDVSISQSGARLRAFSAIRLYWSNSETNGFTSLNEAPSGKNSYFEFKIELAIVLVQGIRMLRYSLHTYFPARFVTTVSKTN